MKKIKTLFQNIQAHPVYSILKDFIIPFAALCISIIAFINSKGAVKDTRTNNDLINNYTVNINSPTFNFSYRYADSRDIITSLSIENEGTSLSTNTINLYPYLEVLVKNNKSEESFFQQEDELLPNKYFYDTVLVPVTNNIFELEYQNNRTGTLATITQSTVYEKLIREIEGCEETFQNGEKIVSIRLKCYLSISYRNLNGEDDIEVENWNTGYVKKYPNSDYNKPKDEGLGVIKIEDTEVYNFSYVEGCSTGRFVPDSRESLIDAIERNWHTDRTGYITIEVKRLGQLQFSDQVKGEPGDIVLFRIHGKNTTDHELKNWHFFVTLPENLEFIEGRTILATGNHPQGVLISDNIITDDGVNLGKCGPNADLWIYFFVRIREDAKEENENNSYTTIAECSAGSITGTIKGTADVIVEVE